MFNTDHVLKDIAAAANCSPEQVRIIAGRVLAALHKIAVCDERSITAAIMESYWIFGDETCYHLGGVLEEARKITDASGEPWTETYRRFAPDEWPKYGPIVDEWMKERTEERKLIDSMPRR